MVLLCYKHVSIHLSKPIEYTTARVNSNIDIDFDVLICVNAGSSVITNIPLSSGMLIIGEGLHVWGRKCMETLYNFHSIFL